VKKNRTATTTKGERKVKPKKTDKIQRRRRGKEIKNHCATSITLPRGNKIFCSNDTIGFLFLFNFVVSNFWRMLPKF
jgi:hypothetical protein